MTTKDARSTGRKGNSGIAKHGEAAAAAKADSTRAAILKAMRQIEADIERYEGIYPYAKGEVTAAEVLRRARLSSTLLQKPRHRGLRDEVKAWVDRVQMKLRKGLKVVRRAVTERADAAKDEVRLIRQRWAEAELEYIENANKIDELTKECARLEAENARLKAALAGENVHPLERKKGSK
ncbi:hypothetical protein KHP60_09720 [Microvirga sp. 3-52]|uniref:hypothetical protein n=1 Tax=Microvirga sp. 3-52 TaxID=2792425 RepID=UPI001AC3948C|nr:hypothetical protein [Microvirga sp. 3-52]MBO1905299.1 hypothetical protein [Microvirga sp. 3-52]MBS7452612.1 hypothetical protein [Microvirga sp. 3-52]